MKYIAINEPGRLAPEYFYPVVTTGGVGVTKDPALRHARAMLEVQRAARAFAKASKRLCKAASTRAFEAADEGFVHADARLMAAVARLERIEKEVRGGK
jgi:hypothetical protein